MLTSAASVFWFNGWARAGVSVTFGSGGKQDRKEWRWEHLTRMRLRDNLRVSAQGFSLFHYQGWSGEGCKMCFKVLLCKNHLWNCFISKRKMLMKQRLLPRAWSPCHLYLPPPPLAPFFWHTRWAVQWQVSQDRLHRVGQSDHFCLRRTESKFFQYFFFLARH